MDSPVMKMSGSTRSFGTLIIGLFNREAPRLVARLMHASRPCPCVKAALRVSSSRRKLRFLIARH